MHALDRPSSLVRRLLLPSLALAIFTAPTATFAALLKSAEVTAVVNDVKIIDPAKGERSAGVRDKVQGDLGIKTGLRSRAELLFQDKTLTRLGANTLFSFNEGTRELELEHGTMLLQVPKNVGGAKIRTAAVTAAITGTTILLEYSPVKWKPRHIAGVASDVEEMAPEQCLLELQHPKRRYSLAETKELQRKAALAKKNSGHVKVMVLEGTLRLYLNNRLGESMLVTAGKMVILSPNALFIPPSVDYDIAQLVKTSLLVNNGYWGGTVTDLNTALVQKQIALQEQLKNNGSLIETNLTIFGNGTQLVMTQIEQNANAQSAGAQSQSSPPSNGPSQSFSAGSSPPNPGGANGNPSPGGTSSGGSSTTTSIGNGPPPFTPGLSGDASIVPTLAGTVPVLPTEGSDFRVLTTAGQTEDMLNRTATRIVEPLDVSGHSPTTQKALTLDYRFLTSEMNTGATVADQMSILISGSAGSIELSLTRDQLQPGGNGSLTPVAQLGVGGYSMGTDWLPFTIDITPFLSDDVTLSLIVWDVGDSVVDSALAIDNIHTGDYPATPAAGIPGKLTLNLDSIAFGGGSGEFAVPNMEGLPARDDAGPAADAGALVVNAPNGITVNATLNASTGANGSDTTYGGTGGRLEFNSTNGAITVNSTVKVSESATGGGKASAAGGNIRLDSGKTTGTAIQINNSGELLALLNASAPGPGGKIEFVSAGGDIQVNGKVIADRGTIDMRNNGPSGQIFLNATAQLAADVIKVGALGADGQLTINAGSQISATNTLKLYGGSGTLGKVLFTGSGNVNISGNPIHIAARTVEINGATHVNNTGPTNVHTENANFGSGAGGGNFQNAPTTGPLSGAPSFD